LARGKITIIAGDPDIGKSQITADIVARITAGTAWPDMGRAPTGSAIILSAEDGAADTVRPRVEAAGGNLDRAHLLKMAPDKDGQHTTFSLQQDLTELGRMIEFRFFQD
jgi:AAA domain-containing protein